MTAAGSNDNGRRDVGGWTDMAAITCGGYHTVGLRADGTMVAIGDHASGQCNVDGWTDILLPDRPNARN